MSFYVNKAGCRDHVFCPAVTLNSGFDHLHIRLDGGLVSSGCTKMAAESPGERYTIIGGTHYLLTLQLCVSGLYKDPT